MCALNPSTNLEKLTTLLVYFDEYTNCSDDFRERENGKKRNGVTGKLQIIFTVAVGREGNSAAETDPRGLRARMIRVV